MKKAINILTCLLLTASCGFLPAANAHEDKPEESSNTVLSNCIETELSGEIKKTEETTVEKRVVAENLEGNPFEYLKVSKTISYVDKSTRNILAIASIVMNFRYNTESRQCVCLSTLRNTYCYSSNYILENFSRCTNKNTETGCGIASLKLFETSGRGPSILKQVVDASSYEVNCDFNGNVTFEPLDTYA